MHKVRDHLEALVIIALVLAITVIISVLIGACQMPLRTITLEGIPPVSSQMTP